MKWHVVTGEYPPQRGGVSTHTRQVARGLAAAGDEVTIWAPPAPAPDPSDAGVVVRRLPDTFGRRSLRLLDAALDGDASPRRLLVQYVPHAYGWKGANVPFCRWVASRRRDAVWAMFHEVGFPFDVRQPPLRNVLALTNRMMARLVARSASRIFVSIPGWRAMLEPLTTPDTEFTWAPVPSGIAVSADVARVAALRTALGDGRPLVGHFGTFPPAIQAQLADALPHLLARGDCRVVLIGPRGDELRATLVARDSALASRVVSTGALPERDVSAHIAACDVMLQPYPDGISTRRTSAMAALAHGVAVVSTSGWLTEPVWRASDAVALVDVGDADALASAAERLLVSDEARASLAATGRRLYDERFDLRHTIAALRDAPPLAASRVCA